MFENIILPKRRSFSTQELLNWIGLGPCENISVLPQALRAAAAVIAHGLDQYSDLLFFLNSAMHSGDSIARYRLTPPVSVAKDDAASLSEILLKNRLLIQDVFFSRKENAYLFELRADSISVKHLLTIGCAVYASRDRTADIYTQKQGFVCIGQKEICQYHLCLSRGIASNSQQARKLVKKIALQPSTENLLSRYIVSPFLKSLLPACWENVISISSFCSENPE